jgi:hypothetical protein
MNPTTPPTPLCLPEGLNHECGDCACCGGRARFGPSFPFRFVETPGGVYVGLSFACTAALRNLGPPLAEQRTALERLLQQDQPDTQNLPQTRKSPPSRRSVEPPFYLAADLPLSWEQYAAVEEDLTALLDPAQGMIGRRLVTQSVYLRLLANFLRQARGAAGAALAGPEANQAALAVFHRQMRGTAEGARAPVDSKASEGAKAPGAPTAATEPWALARNLAAKGRAALPLRRMFLGFAHGLLSGAPGRRRGLLRSYLMLADAYLRQARGRGVVNLPALARPVPYESLRRVHFAPSRPEPDELLTRYFYHCLFRKDLLEKESIHFAHNRLLMRWGLIHWYAAACAAGEGGDEIQLAHLVEAIRRVEEPLALDPTLAWIARDLPILRGFMDRVFDHKLYAFSMGFGEWMEDGAGAEEGRQR